MQELINRRHFLATTGAIAAAWAARPQSSPAAPLAGPEIVAAAMITGEERTRQPDIWTLEVNFKPMRMISVDLPDPKTGEVRRNLVWYVVYRAIRRPSSLVSVDPGASPALARGGVRDSAQERIDPRPDQLFIPECLLLTDDNGVQKSYFDRVLPAAQAAINRRERHKYKNSVEIVGRLPEPTPFDEKNPKSLDGMATFRGVDPNTDRFKLFLSGFSNGYKLDEINGKTVVLRKTLVQEFWRPSDPIEQNEQEIRTVDEPKWIYR